MNSGFAVLTAALAIASASVVSARERPIGVRIEGGVVVTSTPHQFGGTMALPGLAPTVGMGIEKRAAPPLLCALDVSYSRIGPGGLAPGWGTFPENSFTTAPSSLITALIGVRLEPLGPQAAPYVSAGVGVGWLAVGELRMTSMLAPASTEPGRTAVGVALSLGAGVHSHFEPVTPSLNLRWTLVSSNSGWISMVPLSIGVQF